MLAKTHLAIGAFAALLLIDKVTNDILFIPIVLVASLLPDIDTHFSLMGRRMIFRPFQWFTSHRGMWHSFTFAFIISGLCAFYVPVLAFPFFLGYSLHLFVDSFTIEGIRPFWPASQKTEGKLRVGGPIEHAMFVGFCIADVVLLVFLIL